MSHICLDIGNVLVDINMDPFINGISKQFNISLVEANEFVKGVQRQQDLGLTTVTHELRHQFNIRSEVTLNELVSAWNQVVNPNTVSISYFERLVETYNLKVALLSNIGPEHISKFESSLLGESSIWKNSIHYFSCDVGLRKPTRVYYHMFLDEHPEFKGAFYIDDLDDNLDTGKKMGFKAFKLDLSQWTKAGLLQEFEDIDGIFKIVSGRIKL